MKILLLTIAYALLLLLPGASYAQSKRGEFTLAFGFNGVDEARHPEAGRERIRTPVNFRLQLTDKYKLVVGIDHDSFLAKKLADGEWAKGTGNVVLSVRPEFVSEQAGLKRPNVRLSYSATMPTASVSKGLGTGRVDHKILGTVSRRLKQSDTNNITSIGTDFGINFEGKQGQSGFKKSALLNLYFDRKLGDTGKYTLHGEVDLISRAETTPSKIFSTNNLRIKFNNLVSVRVGFVVGITPTYAKAGGYASITFTNRLWGG